MISLSRGAMNLLRHVKLKQSQILASNLKTCVGVLPSGIMSALKMADHSEIFWATVNSKDICWILNDVLRGSENNSERVMLALKIKYWILRSRWKEQYLYVLIW